MRHHFVIADVFTSTAFGGNQLAVFPDARGVPDTAMQALAREFNFAETTFVLPPADPRHAGRIRIFTPKTELPFAGHPTVGTAAVLGRLGLVEAPPGAAPLVFEEGVGPVAVELRLDEADTFARLTLETAPERPTIRPAPAIAATALSLPGGAVRDAWFASVGVPFCFIELIDAAAVDRAALDRVVWTANFAQAWAPNLFLFTGRTQPGGSLYARMFAPALGIEEDPATGSGSATLAGCLAERVADRDGTFTWRIDQGVAMGRPSVLEAAAEKREGRIVNVKVGGSTVLIGEGSITLQPGF